MFVVIEYNQASGQPRVATEDPYPDIEDAREFANELAAEAAAIGRRERYAVAELTIEEAP